MLTYSNLLLLFVSIILFFGCTTIKIYSDSSEVDITYYPGVAVLTAIEPVSTGFEIKSLGVGFHQAGVVFGYSNSVGVISSSEEVCFIEYNVENVEIKN